MKHRTHRRFLVPVIALALAAVIPSLLAQGTAFNYQGKLSNGVGPASGSYDFVFSVFDAQVSGVPIADPITNAAVTISNGQFNVLLDFGPGIFNGETRWLGIGVRTNGAEDFTLLSPRQRLSPTPYALMAASASNVLGTVSAEQLTGTMPEARLSTNVALLNGSPTFTGNVTIQGDLSATRLNVGVSNSIATQNAIFGTIAGGSGNTLGLDANGSRTDGATISGGFSNYIRGAPFATVAGGYGNRIEGQFEFYCYYSVMGGGEHNLIMDAHHATIGGGEGNTVNGLNGWATIGGGWNNANNGISGTIGGGAGNFISGLEEPSGYANPNATIGGGINNTIDFSIYGAGTIGGGSENRIANWEDAGTDMTAGTIAGGARNLVQATYGTIPGGLEAMVRSYGQQAYASGQFGSKGDAQASVYVCRGVTTNALQNELFLDGASQRIVVPTDATWGFDILVTGRASGGDSAAYQIRGSIKNVAGTTSLVGAPKVDRLANDDPSWDVVVLPDNSNHALVIKATGTTAVTIRWVATVRTVEVIF